MSGRETLLNELKALCLASAYFGAWIGVMLLLKQLILAEYRIAFHGLSLAVVGTLVLAKVVLVLEHVPLGRWTRNRPAWVVVVVRTALYALGVFVALVLEKAFEARHEHGGFVPSLMAVFRHVDLPHVWVNTITLSGALLGYNVLSIIRCGLGKGGLVRLFLSPCPKEQIEGSLTMKEEGA